eukprot:364944-Chlamydomonas_euryale.AAC.2
MFATYADLACVVVKLSTPPLEYYESIHTDNDYGELMLAMANAARKDPYGGEGIHAFYARRQYGTLMNPCVNYQELHIPSGSEASEADLNDVAPNQVDGAYHD